MAEEGSLQVGRTQLHLGPGTFLEALYEEEENPANTNFYDGRVISEDPDTATYVVKFDDGDRDTNCIEWKLRPIDVVEWGYLSIGSDVRARWKKDRYYYDAKIVGENVNKKEYDIMFVEDLKRLKGIKCSELRYSSTLTTEEIVPDMIVMVQWSQYKYGPGKVISKTNKSSKEENNMTVIEKLTEIKFHVINNDSEIKECPVYQLSRIYGFVPRTYLGERDDKCSECRKGEDLDEKLKKSVTCTWCKHVWHLACIKQAKEKARAQEPISDGSKWFCPTCTKQGKMKARRRLLTPLQALPGLLEPIGETIDDGNGHKYAVVGVPEPASSGQKRSADGTKHVLIGYMSQMATGQARRDTQRLDGKPSVGGLLPVQRARGERHRSSRDYNGDARGMTQRLRSVGLYRTNGNDAPRCFPPQPLTHSYDMSSFFKVVRKAVMNTSPLPGSSN